MNALRTLLGLVVLLVVGLVAPEVASAKSVTGAENRVRGFQVHVDGGVGVDTDRSVEHVRGFVDTGYDFTSRSPFAAALPGPPEAQPLPQLAILLVTPAAAA